MRFSALLLLITVIPLTLPSQTGTQVAYAIEPENCQLSMQNTYPASAVAGRLILITTTVTNACSYFLLQAIVEIMLPNSAVVLSTAIANPIATNRITAPQMNGFWKLDVVVSFTYYPLTGRLASFRSPITIEVFGPVARTTKSSMTSLRVTTSTTSTTSTSTLISSTTSTSTSNSTIPIQIISTNTTNSSSTSSASPTVQNFWQGSNTILIIAVAFLILFVSIVTIRLRRGRRGAKN